MSLRFISGKRRKKKTTYLISLFYIDWMHFYGIKVFLTIIWGRHNEEEFVLTLTIISGVPESKKRDFDLFFGSILNKSENSDNTSQIFQSCRHLLFCQIQNTNRQIWPHIRLKLIQFAKIFLNSYISSLLNSLSDLPSLISIPTRLLV